MAQEIKKDMILHTMTQGDCPPVRETVTRVKSSLDPGEIIA